jgi:hypothetical protein
MARVRYFKVKRSGEILIGIPKYPGVLLGEMHKLHDLS